MQVLAMVAYAQPFGVLKTIKEKIATNTFMHRLPHNPCWCLELTYIYPFPFFCINTLRSYPNGSKLTSTFHLLKNTEDDCDQCI